MARNQMPTFSYLRENFEMKQLGSLIFILLFSLGNTLFAQDETGRHYKIDRYKSIYFPLGKISFADKLVEYKVGNPAPIKKYRDSTQVLNEPDYTNYHTANFASLG